MIEKQLPNHQRQAGEFALQAFGTLAENSAEYQDYLIKEIGETVTDWQPLNLSLQPTENTSLLELVNTENKIVNKIVLTFTALCLEVKELEKEFKDKFVDEIVLFGEGSNETAVQDEEHVLLVAQFLPKLCDLQVFVKRCQQVFQLLVQQLGAFYDGAFTKSKSSSSFDSHLTDVMDHMGTLLLVLVTIDTIIARHETFTSFWSAYCNMLNSFPVLSQFDHEKLELLREMCSSIDKTVCSGKVFLDAVATLENSKLTERFSKFFQELDKYIKNCLNEVVGHIKPPMNPDMGDKWAKTAVLIVANMKLNHVYTAPWKSVPVKSIISWNPTVALYNCVSWSPAAFIIKHEIKGHLSNILQSQFLDQADSSYITNTTKYFETRYHYLSFQIFNWALNMEADMKKNWASITNDDFIHVPDLFYFGLRYAKKLKVLVTNLAYMHMEVGRPIAQTTVLYIFRLVELIKGIKETFYRHQDTISKIIHHILQRSTYSILLMLGGLKSKVTKGKSQNEKFVDVLSALIIAEQSLHGPVTPTRLLVARISLSLANQDGIFSKDDISKLKINLILLMRLTYLEELIEEATDCKFLSLSTGILPTYFSNLILERSFLERLKYVMLGLGDGTSTKGEEKHIHTLIRELLLEKVVKPLSLAIEKNLRLHAHAHSQGSSEEFQELALTYDMHEIVDTSPICFHRTVFLFPDLVENELNSTWYEMTALAPHAWQMYKEMRILLAHKYKLENIEDHLPSQTVGQEKDVLEIMRQIPSFVQNYKYNLNNQIFIEQDSNSKFLYTINIEQIANSIQTHGTGFLNTTVNYVFQFLKAKVKIVSQFLFDEKIKSRLLKDLNYFRTNKALLNSKYPYKKAEQFNKNIAKLGLDKKGNSFLDLFRGAITEIGNAIGYIRMLKSGALHYISNAASYIPEVDSDFVSFEKMAKMEGMSETTVKTASILDQVILNITGNVTGNMEYIQLLVKSVAPALRDPKNTHFKNFSVIIPPLIVNFCEGIVLAKDKMAKRSKEGAFFTDDGFAMGVAFLLSGIGINTEFDSLHFFDSIKDHFEEQHNSIDKQRSASSKGDEKLEQTLKLMETRLFTIRKEYDLLFYSLSSARVFFRNELREPAVVSSESSNTPA